MAGSPLLSYLLPQHRQLQRRIYPDLCLAQNHCGRVGNPLQNCFYTVRRAAVRPIFRNYQLRPLATLPPRVFWAAKPAFNRVFGRFRPPCEDGGNGSHEPVLEAGYVCILAGRTTGTFRPKIADQVRYPDGPVNANSGHRSDESCAATPARYVRPIDLFEGQVNQPKW